MRYAVVAVIGILGSAMALPAQQGASDRSLSGPAAQKRFVEWGLDLGGVFDDSGDSSTPTSTATATPTAQAWNAF
ncbi:uncharacterized protein PFLUO_LOCUS6837 [Penicillium psychrofluorescens]|uniref:uncharacterized protein n=1 Tax=Penicillium psychrofluorescens TaxID=3158075 RepID=UPI003CCD2BE2